MTSRSSSFPQVCSISTSAPHRSKVCSRGLPVTSPAPSHDLSAKTRFEVWVAVQAAKISSSSLFLIPLPPFSSGDIGKLILPEGMQIVNMQSCRGITGNKSDFYSSTFRGIAVQAAKVSSSFTYSFSLIFRQVILANSCFPKACRT